MSVNKGMVPDRHSGPLIDYPYITWAKLDEMLRNKQGRADTCLEEIFIENGLINPPDTSLNSYALDR